jgi:hypothetical protein
MGRPATGIMAIVNRGSIAGSTRMGEGTTAYTIVLVA